MAVTSLPFALFTIITAAVYFAYPKRDRRWIILLIASGFFYVYNSFYYTAFIALSIITIYLAARKIDALRQETKSFLRLRKEDLTRDERKAHKESSEKKCRRLLAMTLLFNFGILFVLKYFNFMSGSIASILGGSAETAPQIKLLLPLGISFYTFISAGYLIDVYRETVTPEKNIFKFALFVSFFPHIIQGPISSYEKLHHQLIEPHSLEWVNFKHGLILIFWGLFKKLVIADTTWIAIKAYYANGGINGTEDFAGYGGVMVIFIVLAYALQLYADFSGGIDICRGICRVLGVDLDINFRQPYFSRSIGEYWRRWHITLGTWMKNYVFYPIAMSSFSAKISKRIAASKFGQTHVGKHISKVLMTAVASFIVFFLVGIWHGANTKYIAFGVWNGLIIMMSAMLGPAYDKSRKTLHIDSDAAWWKLFQILRTFVIVAIGYVFDISDNFGNAMQMMGRIVTDHNMEAFMDQLSTLGMRRIEYLAIAFGSALLLYVSIRLERTGLDSLHCLLERRSGILQWSVVFILILAIIIFGAYGPSYDPAEFVYMQF